MSLLSQLLNSCYTYESGFELISSVVTAGKKGKEKKKDRKKKERLKKKLILVSFAFYFSSSSSWSSCEGKVLRFSSFIRLGLERQAGRRILAVLA